MKDINRRDLLLGLAASAVALPAAGYTFPNRPLWPFHVSPGIDIREWDVSGPYPDMAFDLEKITVKATQRTIKAVWGMERYPEDEIDEG